MQYKQEQFWDIIILWVIIENVNNYNTNKIYHSVYINIEKTNKSKHKNIPIIIIFKKILQLYYKCGLIKLKLFIVDYYEEY